MCTSSSLQKRIENEKNMFSPTKNGHSTSHASQSIPVQSAELVQEFKV